MNARAQQYVFEQIHIEVARNSTDDFNLFHDKHKWQRIRGNPFGGPIALGFQLECLIEDRIRAYRHEHQEDDLIREHGLRYSNYQFTFANVVHPGEPIAIEIKKSQFKPGEDCVLANRVVMKNDAGIVLLGYKKESQRPLFFPENDTAQLPDLNSIADRSLIAGGTWFMKRKFMNTGNAKNFLSGSLVEQSEYFDEIDGKAHFPEIFPVSLISCALLERAFQHGHDFEKEPMVYTNHSITIDRDCLEKLHSNDVVHYVVSEPATRAGDRGLGKTGVGQQLIQCLGLVRDGGVLFSAEIAMAPLQEILKSFPSN